MKIVLIRIGRVFLSLIVAGAVAQYSNEPLFIYLTPALSGIGKYLREKSPTAWNWLPF